MISENISRLINDNLEVTLDLKDMQPYLNRVAKALTDLLDVQNNVNRLYNRARGNVWNDQIAYDVGIQLQDTQHTTYQIYETMHTVFSKVLCPYCNSLAKYAELKDWHTSCPEWTQIQKLKIGGTMGTKINKTAVAGIEEFRKALHLYIDNTRYDLQSIRSAHKEVRSSWRDALAKAMDDELANFDTTLKKQLDALENQYTYVVKKRDDFVEALRTPKGGK